MSIPLTSSPFKGQAGSQQKTSGSSKGSSQTVPELRVHPKYFDYIRDKEYSLRQKGEPGTYRFPSFGQFDQKSAPIPLDPSYSDERDKDKIHPFAGQNVLKDYDKMYPEEKDLPKNAEGHRSVYGEHPQTGSPLYGPAHWYHFYKDWHEVGPKLREWQPIQFPLCGNFPLNQDELTYCRNAFGIEFIKRLGAGNYGAVWEVTRTWKERKDRKSEMVQRRENYACKICNLKRILDDFNDISRIPLRTTVEYLIKEADITNAYDFHHPNVLKAEYIFHIHDDTTGFPFIRTLMLMEICDGDLEGMLGYLFWSKTLSEDEARPIMLDICHGLNYLHYKGIAHLDIKPPNILFKVDPKSGKRIYKLSDFGFAEKVDTTLEYGPGTPGYQAPELYEPYEKDLLKADVYSLGKCLLQMLIGRWYMAWTKPDLWPPDINNYPPGWETDPTVLENWCKKYGLSMTVGDLYRRMTQHDYQRRPTMQQVIADPWFTMDSC